MHIVICPWLAFGHLLPCLELADRLASRGHRVSFVSTPRNISRLPPLRPAVAPLISLVALPLPRVVGLPEGAESTNDISQDKDMLELHRMASDGLAAPFSEFLDAAEKKPDWVIVDSHPFWAVAAAVKRNIPCAGILLCPASLLARWAGHLPAGSGQWKKEFTTQGASGFTVAQRCSMTLQGCQFVAFRSCVELEPEAVSVLTTENRGGKSFVTLGLLPPSPEGRGGGKDSDEGVRSWLDAQPDKSVVYVALGSEVPLRAEQVHEMALGLELTGKRFLWALRKPVGVALPPGFEERTRGRGLVAMAWVSQVSVLAHPAVAAFLTHCGWNSTIEGLLYGHPLIMLPISGDQCSNAMLVEGKEVGVQVARQGDDGSFDREAIATAVRVVTAEDGVYGANAKKLQEIVADRERHERCVDGFVEKLRSYME
jgi:UDP:flavonoid glycosyltransferase YjiC (YdhE family)